MYSGKLFVAAFDFGSTHSGYAFSACRSPNSIYTSKWEHNGLLFDKAPTSVLINKNNEFVAFGFDAENKYIMNMENNYWDSDDSDQRTNDEYRYFNRFKMELHNQRVNLKTLIKDQNGEEMKALDIFAIAIEYLNKQVIGKLNTLERLNVRTQDLHYVITVPAIWDDQEKMFMRKAAEQVGINGNQVSIALEHEAALIYCHVLRPYDQRYNIDISFFDAIKRDKNYVVVDLGGGTFDITVHKKRSDGFLEEVVRPSRGAWGETAIDYGIQRFLENVFGEKVMKELRLKELEDYITLMYELEVKKRSIKSDTISDIVITMPFCLREIIKRHCGGIVTVINNSEYSDSISICGQKLLVNAQTFRDLFKPTINSLLKHLEQLFRHPEVSEIQQIIMVGGFSECELVQKAMEDNFPNKEIFIPEEVGLAVLKGAVLYGHQPKQIRR
ncbi:unnamed protein product [Mytilus coruscus]|uniref:HSPA12B n=1 Tax=Mytilus coruscus TaxID=42192 RepID=A0A6J8F2B4_MYTCO|nr:unnamed protein product [Mytilus coruscus]